MPGPIVRLRIHAFAAVAAAGCNALSGAGDLTVADLPAPEELDARVPEVTSGDAAPAEAGLTPGPDLDAGQDAAADPDADTGPKRVFVTSTGSTANLGGLAGADQRCNAAAAAAGLGGSWLAFLSVRNVVDARDRVQGTGPWYLVTGELAVTKAELSDPPLTRAVDRDEKGNPALGFVWTGSGPTGRFFDDDCTAWTSESLADHASTGDLRVATGSWLAARPGACVQMNRLYCFER